MFETVDRSKPPGPPALTVDSRISVGAVVLASIGASFSLMAATPAIANLPAPASRKVDFARDIQPLLASHCIECHGAAKQKGGYRLDGREAALKGGESYSPAIKPGDSAGSPFIHLVGGLVADTRMPAKGDALNAEQIGLLRAWIDQGAVWPEENSAKADDGASHWSFRPVTRPVLPSGSASPGKTASNPIDAFVHARLAREGLAHSPEADRTTLMRRLYFVMLGMPPSPEEVAAFRSDARPDAYERLVDRVLDDPRYGERWGRHWLDVIRFAESNGFETNRERTTAWRFRDYIIAAFNEDKPYDQFVREQIAGDSLGVDVATGFLVGGPVDIVKSPDPVLTAQQRADELDDMIGTTGTAFLGLTVGCARCHSHKFDPISQREYYALGAIFSGVQHGERAQPLPPEQQARLGAIDAQIREREQQLSRFLVPPAATGARPAVQAGINEDTFAPMEARFLRFTIRASGGAEPCLDELEVWSGTRNVALATNGTRVTASGTLPGYEIHKLEHVNDGRTGNNRSWISNQPDRGWVQLEFAKPERIERVTWGRDREGQFRDRVATDYVIEAGLATNQLQRVSSSEGRKPVESSKPAGPVYRFESFAEADARQGREWLADLERLREERKSLAKSPSVYAGNFSQPGPTHRLHRGDPMQKREVVAPGTLALFKPQNLAPEAPEGQRRRTLADWIASPENPLTARVFVNRVWQHHFGVGLVDTPNDFGRNGTRPTHPELLDWLADEFMHPAAGSASDAPSAKAWSVKHLHRLILTSATWRQSSAPRPDAAKVDAASRLLWRFPPRRLEAEAIRDGVLEVSGNLDRTMGGPSFFLHQVDRENVYHYHPKEEFGPAESRRMVYAFKVRMEQDGIFGSFDCPDGSLVMPRRSLSTTPLQALNLFNSRFILGQAGIFAARLQRESGPDVQVQVNRAWQLAYNRAPAPPEAEDAVRFARTEGLPALCRAVLNSNEFLFIP